MALYGFRWDFQNWWSDFYSYSVFRWSFVSSWTPGDSGCSFPHSHSKRTTAQQSQQGLGTESSLIVSIPSNQTLPSQGITLRGHRKFPALRVSCFSQERYDGRLGLTGLQVLSSSLNLLVPQDLSQYSVLVHEPNMKGTRKYFRSFHESLYVYLCIYG